jgi:septum formation protein
MKFVLASRSPRRKELLGKIVNQFDIITRETDETLPSGVHPKNGVEILAVRKGRAVADEMSEDSLIISSDTLVELDGVALGKPIDKEDAVKILLRLSGKTHNVHTGVAVHYKGKVFSGSDTSSVTFRSFEENEARDYVATGEPMDKAGAYAIQGIGGKFVKEYDGEFDTIVGLSISLTEKLIKQAIENEEN